MQKDEGVTHASARRRVLTLLAGMTCAPQICRQLPALAAPAPNSDVAPHPYASVMPGHVLRFPHDEGSHPDFRIEWWYVTGWLTNGTGKPLGFQITFFRTRPRQTTTNPSSFAPHQVLIVHAALSDPARGRLQHDQRAARMAFGLAGAGTGRTDVWIDDWSLRQQDGHYAASVAARAFRIDLKLAAAQQALPHGTAGYSQKGPQPGSASYYYSIPQLEASGTIIRNGQTEPVRGVAWLDHEWSSSYMDERAVGWDWIGINFEDGSAMMAFQMRGPGGKPFWTGGTYRSRARDAAVFPVEAVQFTPLRWWRSPRTGTDYPVSWKVRVGDREVELTPLFDDQENDTRATTGAIYWEGAVRALVAAKPVGRGYLELTGYWRPLQL